MEKLPIFLTKRDVYEYIITQMSTMLNTLQSVSAVVTIAASVADSSEETKKLLREVERTAPELPLQIKTVGNVITELRTMVDEERIIEARLKKESVQ